jgi:uncharacterized protein YecE (DUF72 family)
MARVLIGTSGWHYKSWWGPFFPKDLTVKDQLRFYASQFETTEQSANSLELLEERLSLLGGKVGPILFQLPPHFEVNADRLASFFKLLSNKRRYSFEFRHPSWYQPRILRMLAEQNISLCLSDHHDAPAPWTRTANFVYVRGQGPSGRYHGNYRRPTLTRWAQRHQILETTRLRCLRVFRQ